MILGYLAGHNAAVHRLIQQIGIDVRLVDHTRLPAADVKQPAVSHGDKVQGIPVQDGRHQRRSDAFLAPQGLRYGDHAAVGFLDATFQGVGNRLG